MERIRVRLDDGAPTTLHVASYERRAFDARVVVLERAGPLVRWCEVQGVRDAVVGGFFSRSQYLPLEHVQIDGVTQPSLAVEPPWGTFVRACTSQMGFCESRAGTSSAPRQAAICCRRVRCLSRVDSAWSLTDRMWRGSLLPHISSIRISLRAAIRAPRWRSLASVCLRWRATGVRTMTSR